MMSYNDSDYFHELYQSRWSKWASVAFSISATSASLIFIYSIIWFEHFGSDERRTLPVTSSGITISYTRVEIPLELDNDGTFL